ncbi:Hypothetical protein CINCED_3A006609 [Cinara cedri]|uniref:Uncharacterized protein n=1 Tax=Cinara cedri TaxID=506608 RepID=A0A5E4MAG0_9HEMI|nr:Hypothetical protein CINCED_3A006609 [Cinara cedri]
MAFTVVLGLAVLSVANQGHTFTITATGVKPTIKPFSPFTTQQPQLSDLTKSTFGSKNEAPKPFGAPFEPFKQPYQPYQPFKQPYQPYQPGPFRTNYQPFGPFPGYPGPIVYPGQVGYPSGPSVYPQQQQHPAFHFDQHKQFGLQPFPSAPFDQTVSPFKLGSSKKFNKSPSGFFDFNQPGKYFQEHQFGAYHGPEFSSAVVPAEHNLKQSKPKDIFLGKPSVPIVPAFSSFGFSKEGGFGLPSPASFGYKSPIVPPTQVSQSLLKTLPPFVKNTFSIGQNFSTTPATTTSTEVSSSSSNEEPATPTASEVTGEPSSASPAADPQPTSPSQEEVTASVAATATEVATNNEAPAADDIAAAQQQQQSEQQSNLSEDNDPKIDNTDAVTVSAATGENTDSVQLTDSSQVSTKSESAAEPAVVPTKEVIETTVTGDASSDPSESFSEATIFESSTDTVASAGSSQETDFGKSEQAQASLTPKTNNFPGQQAGETAFVSDLSTANLFPTSKFSNFEQSIDLRQPSYYSYIPQYNQLNKNLPSHSGGNFIYEFGFNKKNEQSEKDKSTKEDEKPELTTVTNPSSSEVSNTSVAAPSGADNLPKKINAVQIIQDGSFDPFNGQLPLLFDPSSAAAGSPLDTFGFYNHPSVTAFSSQASLASYSPEDAFSNFGTNQFRTQGFLVEGSPSLTPLPAKTIVQTSRTPVSISSVDHPLHGQVFKYSQSFVPYPALVQAGNTAEVPSSTTTPTAIPVESSSSISTTAATAAATA